MAGGGALGAQVNAEVDEFSLGGDKPRPTPRDMSRLGWLLVRRMGVVFLGLLILILVFASLWRAVELPNERAITIEHLDTMRRSEMGIREALAHDPVALAWFEQHQAELLKYASSKSSCPNPDRPMWDWSGSVYFSFTVLSTIGYGTFGPATDAGKVMVVILGFIGILLFGLGLGLISAVFDDILDTVVLYLCPKYTESRQILVKAGITVGLYLIHWCFSGLLFWLLWRDRQDAGTPTGYWEALYFSFVTFSTIGFGDYNPDWHAWDVIVVYAVTFTGLILFSELIAVGTETYKNAVKHAVSKGSRLVTRTMSSTALGVKGGESLDKFGQSGALPASTDGEAGLLSVADNQDSENNPGFSHSPSGRIAWG